MHFADKIYRRICDYVIHVVNTFSHLHTYALRIHTNIARVHIPYRQRKRNKASLWLNYILDKIAHFLHTTHGKNLSLVKSTTTTLRRLGIFFFTKNFGDQLAPILKFPLAWLCFSYKIREDSKIISLNPVEDDTHNIFRRTVLQS